MKRPAMLLSSISRVTTVAGLLALLLAMLWTLRLMYNGPFTSIILGSSTDGKTVHTPMALGPTNGRPPSTPVGKMPPNVPGPPAPAEYDLADPDAPYVSWPLRRLCDEMTWREGLVFFCDNNSGGIGNIRNAIQICLRYAIGAGATGIVLPDIRTRNEKKLADLFQPPRPFSYMFDEAHFRAAMAEGCPQITIYPTARDIPNAGPDPHKKIEQIMPKSLAEGGDCDGSDPNRRSRTWRADFNQWLLDKSIADAAKDGIIRHPPSLANPRLIRFEWGVMFDFETYLDGPELYATFGSVLKIRPDLIALGRAAAAALRALAHQDGGRFLGCHLRSEADAAKFWPNFDYQTERYLEEARQRKFTMAYVATGDAGEAQRFKDMAKRDANLQVYTATDLLGSSDRAALHALTWDQRGIVDFVVLLDSDFFVGVTPSSYSITLGLRRHLRLDGLYSRPFRPGHENETDGQSRIVGRYGPYRPMWMSLWDGMWP